MSRIPQHHPTVTQERVAKGLDSAFLPTSSTNLSQLRWASTTSLNNIEVAKVDGRPTWAHIAPPALTYEPVSCGHRFGPLWSTHWVRITYSVPSDWKGRVFLIFDPNSEAALYTSDGRVLAGNTGGENPASFRGNRRAEYLVDTPPGGSATMYIEVACNGLFGGDGSLVGKVDPSQSFELACAELRLLHDEGHALVYDMLLLNDLIGKADKHAPLLSARALSVANAVLNMVERRDERTYGTCRRMVQEVLRPAKGNSAQQSVEQGMTALADTLTPRVLAVGHCHIDTAWLWSFAETRRKVVRSWASQLHLMESAGQGDARFTFAASQACHYAWLREDHPALFARVKAAVASGRFIPVGVSWVEPDANMPSGESLVRQLLYGYRELKEHLGKEIAQAAVTRAKTLGQSIPSRVPVSDVFWLPDTFGYCPQLPAILTGAGLRYFLTQKLSWSLVNKPEHNTFWWTALDGSSVLSHFPPGNNYNCSGTAEDVLASVHGNKDAGRSNLGLMLYGVGDGGGGPNPPMFEQMRRLGAGSLTAPHTANLDSPYQHACATLPASLTCCTATPAPSSTSWRVSYPAALALTTMP